MRRPVSLALRYWETVRHLRPVQIYGRMWFRATRPRPDLRPAPSERHVAGPWVEPAARPPSLFGPDTFRFLNDMRTLATGWDDPAVEKLWRYNLHYFDDLTAEAAPTRRAWHLALMDRWVAENPVGQGTGWEPYPTSLRLVNWVKWRLAGYQLTPPQLLSLVVQARWLAARLEVHLLGNHLFANAKALVFVGSLFDGPEAETWRRRGLALIERELPEQILPDGGQFELSPMYHALALEDLLDLVNLSRATDLPPPRGLEERIPAMRGWLAAMTHPDGEVAFFNDAATGIAPPPAALDAYAQRLGYPPLPMAISGQRWLRDSGYIRLDVPGASAILDVARIGPDYLPGHAHADTLSFELSVAGFRAIVNSGTGVYGTGPERLRQRGTPAHSTVAVDRADSSEVWSGFRAARRARPLDLILERADGGWRVACAHDGYRWLPGRPRHHRTWHFAPNRLTVADRVAGQPTAPATAAFHFHPDLTASLAPDGSGALSHKGAPLLHWTIEQGRARLEPGTWHPQFGTSVANQRLMLDLLNNESCIQFSWGEA